MYNILYFTYKYAKLVFILCILITLSYYNYERNQNVKKLNMYYGHVLGLFSRKMCLI